MTMSIASNESVAAAAHSVAKQLTAHPNDIGETRMIADAFELFAEALGAPQLGAPNVAPTFNYSEPAAIYFPAASNVAPTFNGSRKPTSELLTKAANTLQALMSGRGIDRRNGHDWDGFIRDLYDRAAAFKTIEDMP
jgi:hypothetical protein